MHISFTPEAFLEYSDIQGEDKKTADRINKLIKDIMRNPFTGIGKPEPLKHRHQGYWSRRIDEKNRLIYRVVGDQEIRIVQCRGHYQR